MYKTSNSRRAAEWNRNNADRRAATRRAKYQRRKAEDPMYLRRVKVRQFGMELEDYDDMLERQGGGCAVCGVAPSPDRALCIDHDHNCCPSDNRCCGRCVRGLLCDRCNRMLGQARDDPQVLRAAAEYLCGWDCARPD